MRIALAQINTRLADWEGNAAKILAGVERAKAEKAEIVLFPELAICGYPPRDLLDRPDFAKAAASALARIAAKVDGITAVIGSIRENPKPSGKLLYNAAEVVAGGKVVSTYRKCLLPTYDVFDEARYFEPSAEPAPTTIAGRPFALSICEDIWDDPDYSPQRLYGRDPVGAMVEMGGMAILNVSASPFAIGKPAQRLAMLGGIARKHRVPLAYVNLVGGNDELMFDGYSLVLDANGRVIASGKPFEEDFLVADLDAPGSDGWAPRAELADVRAALVLGTRDYVRKCGLKSAVIGLSGGVDSALTAVIAEEALGAENVLGVSLPTRFTASMSRDDARLLAKNLGIAFDEIAIEDVFKTFLAALTPSFGGKAADTTEENLQSRIRGTVLMALSNKLGHLLLSTGNKSEMAVGYCTIYGDMNGGLAVISDVPKTMVYKLCERINAERGEVIPRRTLTRAPSAELKENQTDQDSLPPYEVLDRILDLYIVDRRAPEEIVALTGYAPGVVADTIRKIERSEFKRRQAAPGIKVTAKAFGMGRRNPIARSY
jgi:NAD+ synthase (glutamine-hydrolysing)